MPLRPSAAGRAPTVVGWLLGLVCFLYLLALPPTLNGADESFILYGAKRVLQGQALYRDFFAFLTPGSFYLYALAYRLGGVSITSARVTTALLNALSATCTYFLALHVASMGEAILAGLLVVVLCVPVWNMASHHWIATAFGLATAAMLLAPRWQGSTRARPAAAGALAGLLVSSHQARGLWLILWLAVAVPLRVLVRGKAGRWRQCVRELVWTGGGGAAVCVPVLGHAVWRASLAEMLYATHTWVVTSYWSYNVGTFPWAAYGAFWATGLKYTSYWLMKATPVLLGVETVALLWALWRWGLREGLVRLLLLLLALSAVGAIMYFPDIVHIAFILPFVLVVGAGMIHRVRTALVSGKTPAARVVLRGAWAAALAAVLVKGWSDARLAWREAPVLYQTAFGTLAAGSAFQAETIRDLRAALRVDAGAPPRLFAHSTDAWIYLALPADNPTPFALLRPGYNTPAQFQTAIDRLERDPHAVVLLNLFSTPPDDPFVVYLRTRWRDVAGIGPPIFVGKPLYRLYARDAAG